MSVRTSYFMVEDKQAHTMLRWDDMAHEAVIWQGSIMTVIRILGLPTSHLVLPETDDAKEWEDIRFGTKVHDCTGNVVAIYSKYGGLRIKVGERMIRIPLPEECDIRTMSGTC